MMFIEEQLEEQFRAKLAQFDSSLILKVHETFPGGRDHWRITGHGVAVSWWPFSIRKSVYFEFHRKTYHDVGESMLFQLMQKHGKVERLIKKAHQNNRKNFTAYDLKCPLCNGQMLLRTDSRFAKHRLWYACEHWPDCKGCHGAHKNGKPLGVPAGAETKKWRIQAHEAFDRLWKNGPLTRSAAYQLLAKELSLSKDQCHIGCFDISTCQKVLQIVDRSLKDLEESHHHLSLESRK